MDTPTGSTGSAPLSQTSDLSPEELEEIARDLEADEDGSDGDDSPDTPDAAPAASPPPATVPSPSSAPTDAPATPPGTPADATAKAPGTTPDETPFTFTVDKTDVAIPGITKGADGRIHLTESAWTRLRSQHLANRQVFVQRETQFRQAIEQVRQEQAQRQTAEQAKAQALLSVITQAAQQGDQAIADMAYGFAQKLPQLTAEAEARFYREQAERASGRLQPIEQQQSRADALPWLWESVEGYLGEMLAQPEHTGLDPERATAALKSVEDRLFYFDPQTQQWMIDGPVFKRELAREAEYARREAELKAQVAAAAALQQRNRAVLDPATQPNTPPPAVSAKVAPPSPEATGSGRPATREEWQERMRGHLRA